MQSKTTWDERRLARKWKSISGPSLMWAEVQARLAERGNLSAWVCEAITEKLNREKGTNHGKTN